MVSLHKSAICNVIEKRRLTSPKTFAFRTCGFFSYEAIACAGSHSQGPPAFSCSHSLARRTVCSTLSWRSASAYDATIAPELLIFILVGTLTVVPAAFGYTVLSNGVLWERRGS